MSSFTTQPLFAVTLTIGVWILAARGSRLAPSALNPVLTSTLAIISVLVLLQIPVEQYQSGAAPLTLLLPPAVVALAIPIRRHARRLLRLLPAILITAVIASAVGIAVTSTMAWLLGASAPLTAALVPKHATSAVAASTATVIGGDAALAAVFAILTGVLGAVAGPPLLRLLRVEDPQARGLAMGLSAHAIGTSRAFATSESDGAASALAMALAALIVPILVALAAGLGWLPTR